MADDAAAAEARASESDGESEELFVQSGSTPTRADSHGGAAASDESDDGDDDDDLGDARPPAAAAARSAGVNKADQRMLWRAVRERDGATIAGMVRPASRPPLCCCRRCSRHTSSSAALRSTSMSATPTASQCFTRLPCAPVSNDVLCLATLFASLTNANAQVAKLRWFVPFCLLNTFDTLIYFSLF